MAAGLITGSVPLSVNMHRLRCNAYDINKRPMVNALMCLR